jgi:hypothetical protein
MNLLWLTWLTGGFAAVEKCGETNSFSSSVEPLCRGSHRIAIDFGQMPKARETVCRRALQVLGAQRKSIAKPNKTKSRPKAAFR